MIPLAALFLILENEVALKILIFEIQPLIYNKKLQKCHPLLSIDFEFQAGTQSNYYFV